MARVERDGMKMLDECVEAQTDVKFLCPRYSPAVLCREVFKIQHITSTDESEVRWDEMA